MVSLEALSLNVVSLKFSVYHYCLTVFSFQWWTFWYETSSWKQRRRKSISQLVLLPVGKGQPSAFIFTSLSWSPVISAAVTRPQHNRRSKADLYVQYDCSLPSVRIGKMYVKSPAMRRDLNETRLVQRGKKPMKCYDCSDFFYTLFLSICPFKRLPQRRPGQSACASSKTGIHCQKILEM